MTEQLPQNTAAIDLFEEGRKPSLSFFRNATGLDIFYPLKDKGWFSPERNPIPFRDQRRGLFRIPHWPVLYYLEKVAAESVLPKNWQYAKELMQILRDVTRPSNDKKVDNYETWYSFSKIISVLPTDVIKVEDIELISDWLDTQFTGMSLLGDEIGNKFLPKLLKKSGQHEIVLATRVVDVLSRIKWCDKKVVETNVQKEAITAIEPYWLNEIFQSNARLIGRKCGRNVINTLCSRLKEVTKRNNLDRLSYIWRPAIKDCQKKLDYDADIKNIFVSALRDALLGYSEKRSLEVKDCINRLFNDESLIILRLAIYLTDKRFDIFKEAFQESFRPGLLNLCLMQELCSLFERHFDKLTPQKKTQIIEAIEGLNEIWIHNNEETEIANACLRLNWLSALIKTNDKRVIELYRKYEAIVGPNLINMPDIYTLYFPDI